MLEGRLREHIKERQNGRSRLIQVMVHLAVLSFSVAVLLPIWIDINVVVRYQSSSRGVCGCPYFDD